MPTKRETASEVGAGHKLCSKCKKLKPLAEFNFKRRAEGIRHSYCRDCGKGLTRSHYRRRKRAYLDRNLRAYNERRLMVIAAKSRPCADCGVQYPYYVMDFDHREGVKKEFPCTKSSARPSGLYCGRWRSVTWFAPTATASARTGA